MVYDYDFAICYFGLTRSTKLVYPSHFSAIFTPLTQHGLTYQTFMHTWSTVDGTQCVWSKPCTAKIDYEEYKLLQPHVYQCDAQEAFLATVNMDDYFYKHVPPSQEWLPELVRNHLCALESQRRCWELVQQSGKRFKQIMFVRPDVGFATPLPLAQILAQPQAICIPNFDHHEGYNDRFAILSAEHAPCYANRIQELAAFRRTQGRIVSEKYVKYIIQKYKLPVNLINFRFTLVRPPAVSPK